MARKIAVEIVGDASSLERAFKKSERSAQRFNQDMSRQGRGGSRVFGGLTKAVGFATAGLGVAGLAGAAHAAFAEMQNAQQVSAQTEAALKSTGRAANVTAKHVDELADAMLNKSGIDDEATKTAENMLLTFTKVRNEVGKGNRIFDQATSAVADMATRMNGGAIPSAEQMQQAALRLGKALNDPVKGVGALARVGVQFTKAQVKQIKTLVATGHTLEAQKVILRELRTEFGGSAQAAGQTLAGQLEKLRNVALNLGAAIATTLTPSIQKVVERLVKWLNNSKNQQQILNTVNSAARALAAVLKILQAAFSALSKVVGGSANAIKVLVAAFVVWKGLQMASAVSKVAGSFGLLTAKTTASTAATTRATAASRGLSASFIGKAGLVGAAGAASFALTTMILNATGLDKKLAQLGASAFDAAAKIGLIHDPTAQFKGKSILGGQATRFLRNQAARLEAGGLSPAQAAARITATHPNVAGRDAQVIAGVFGRPPVYHIQNLNVTGVQNPAQMENELQKRARGRPHRRRGA
jgi:hypothetical protein